ncbi:MAG: hypothetical protein ABIP74_02600 [Candidatus Saccharimonas sp.]
MPAEKIIHPAIKQSFDAIEDQIVVDAIAERMDRIHSRDGQTYNHDTYTSSHRYMGYIADACASIYAKDATLSHEEVWQKAQDECCVRALSLSRDLNEILESETRSISGERYKIEAQVEHNISATVAMYAIDLQAGLTNQDLRHPIDALFARGSGIPTYIMWGLGRQFADQGLVAIGDGTRMPVNIASVVSDRPKEIEKINYDEFRDDFSSYTSGGRYLFELERAHEELRYAEYISNEQYDALLQQIIDSDGAFDGSVYALNALPFRYLSALRDSKPELASGLDAHLLHMLDGLEHTGRRFADYCRFINRYYPDGVTAPQIASHPTVQEYVQQFSSFEQFIVTTLPSEIYKEQSFRAKAAEHNRASRQVILMLAEKLFGNDEFSNTYAERVQSSFEPRKFNDGQQTFYASSMLRASLYRMISLVDDIGPDSFKELDSQFDLGAVDMFTSEDLRIMQGITKKDPAILEELRGKDVSLVAFDPYGSNNEAMTTILAQLDTTTDLTARVLVPWTHPEAIYRSLALLKSREVEFCNLIVAAHGSPGITHFNRGSSAFVLLSKEFPSTVDSEDYISRSTTRLHINLSSVSRVVKERMCAPKHAVALGLPNYMRLIFASCHSAQANSSANMPSIAESALRAASSPQVVTMGTTDISTVSTGHIDGKGLYMFDENDPGGRSNMVALELNPEPGWIKTSDESSDIIRTNVDQRITA